MTPIGILVALVAVVVSMTLDHGQVTDLIKMPAIILVLGGSLGATIAGFDKRRLRSVPKAAKLVMLPGESRLSTSTTVRNTDIGSLRPDSISRTPTTRSGNAMPARRSSVETAAASVGESTAPRTDAACDSIPNARAVQVTATALAITRPILRKTMTRKFARISRKLVFRLSQ